MAGGDIANALSGVKSRFLAASEQFTDATCYLALEPDDDHPISNSLRSPGWLRSAIRSYADPVECAATREGPKGTGRFTWWLSHEELDLQPILNEQVVRSRARDCWRRFGQLSREAGRILRGFPDAIGTVSGEASRFFTRGSDEEVGWLGLLFDTAIRRPEGTSLEAKNLGLGQGTPDSPFERMGVEVSFVTSPSPSSGLQPWPGGIYFLDGCPFSAAAAFIDLLVGASPIVAPVVGMEQVPLDRFTQLAGAVAEAHLHAAAGNTALKSILFPHAPPMATPGDPIDKAASKTAWRLVHLELDQSPATETELRQGSDRQRAAKRSTWIRTYNEKNAQTHGFQPLNVEALANILRSRATKARRKNGD